MIHPTLTPLFWPTLYFPQRTSKQGTAKKTKKKNKSGDTSGDVIDIFPVDKLAEGLQRVCLRGHRWPLCARLQRLRSQL